MVQQTIVAGVADRSQESGKNRDSGERRVLPSLETLARTPTTTPLHKSHAKVVEERVALLIRENPGIDEFCQ